MTKLAQKNEGEQKIMKKREMQKTIKARAGLKNYSAITNIKWKRVPGIGATKWNALDDIITFDYKGCKCRLESKYTGEHSALQKHELVINETLLKHELEINETLLKINSFWPDDILTKEKTISNNRKGEKNEKV